MKKPRIVIKMQGGLIEDVITDIPARYLLIDLDAHEFGDKEDIRIIEDARGNEVEVYEIDWRATSTSKKVVDHYFGQIKKQRASFWGELPGVPDLTCEKCGQPESEHDDGACPRKIRED